MSSGQRKIKHPFNDTQIKDGWIVKMRKDGTIKAKLEPWVPGGMKKDGKK